MTTQRSSSAAWVRGILDMMAAEGLAVERLSEEANIDLAALQHSQTRIDVDRVSRLWELAVAQSANPTLGLDRQLAARHGNIDLVGYSLASSPHLLAGFRDLERHMAVISDATAFTLERDARGHWLSIHHIGATRAVPRQRVEFAVLTLLVLCSWLTRREVQPLAVEFMAQAPSPLHEARYRQAFGLLPRFGERANRFLLSQDDLLAPIPTHNPELLALHENWSSPSWTSWARPAWAPACAMRLRACCPRASRAASGRSAGPDRPYLAAPPAGREHQLPAIAG